MPAQARTMDQRGWLSDATLTSTLTLLATGVSLLETLEALVRGIEAEHPELLCSVLLLNDAGTHLQLAVAPSLPAFYNAAVDGLAIGPDIGSCGTAAYTGRRAIAEDILTDPRWVTFTAIAVQAGLRSCWSEPIIGSTGRTLGTFAMYQGQPSTPSAQDIQSITAAAQLAAIAIERRQAEEALRASEALARQALEERALLSETAGVGTWSYDPRTDALRWSAEWLEALVSDETTMKTGEGVLSLCHPEDLPVMRAVMGAAITDGASGGFSHRLRSDSEGWIHARVHVRAEAIEGGLHIVHGISQNTTELVRARDAALESEVRSQQAQGDAEALAQRLKVALRAAEAVVVEVDYHDQNVWVSPHFVDLVGRSLTYPEARQTVWPFVHREDASQVTAAVHGWLIGAPCEPIEVRILRPDGAERWMRICTEIEKDVGGRWRRTISLLLDIDERKRQELALIAAERAAQAAAEAKSTFLANMSHEIRTPLNGVVAVAEMLARADLPLKAREMAEIIRSSGDTLQRLLSDILDVARIESGKIAIEAAPFHISKMVRAAAALSQLKCDEKGVRLTVSVAPEVDEVVIGDAVRVRQVVTNLLSNAAKFTERGEITLAVDRTALGRTRFCVTDTGVGFDMADKPKVLGRFQQADNSITRRFGGTGLGLSICCELAALMGGVLDCDSTPGRGSRFWLELPMEAASDEIGPVVEDVTDAPSGEALHILLADDHPTNRKVVELMLDGGLAELTSVEDGAQALEMVRKRRFDLILMDMQMPVMDGLTAIEEIRRLEDDRGAERTPIIMLTANALPEHVVSAAAAGADLHLAKPFTASALFEAINAALSETCQQEVAA